jgi:hypothetical protein
MQGAAVQDLDSPDSSGPYSPTIRLSDSTTAGS